eukprot:TRINITY_DN11855_c3_g1_i1.p4 TRINITY_DN11855_c3_g1~~TRINITY_DN11855_c3_g1_i1.p4  ORF type:complete len:123 (-),score=2.46 TRINITY_DN11855_c3_g1_i1:8-376(-)
MQIMQQYNVKTENLQPSREEEYLYIPVHNMHVYSDDVFNNWRKIKTLPNTLPKNPHNNNYEKLLFYERPFNPTSKILIQEFYCFRNKTYEIMNYWVKQYYKLLQQVSQLYLVYKYYIFIMKI